MKIKSVYIDLKCFNYKDKKKLKNQILYSLI